MKEKQHFYVLNYAEKKRFAQIIIFSFLAFDKKRKQDLPSGSCLARSTEGFIMLYLMTGRT